MKHRFNPRQPRDGHGRWTSGVSAVPYSRHSLRSQTIGVNAGTNLSKNYRLSVGGYARIERRKPTALEKSAVAKNNQLINKIAKKVSPSEKLEPVIHNRLRHAQNRAVAKVLGRTVNAGKKVSVRGGTTRAGLPSVTVRYGGTVKKASRRAAGIEKFNNQMAGKQIKSKTPRPQRRGKRVA